MFKKKSNEKTSQNKLVESSSVEAGMEEKIGISFKDKKYIHRALVHRSYLNENPNEIESNERLEFLGDAILEFVVSEHLFNKFPSEDEGHLTALRSKLVNTTSLAQAAEEIGLGNALYMSKGEEKSGGRNNTGLLANTTEAIIGAIFEDSGIEKAKEFIEKFVLRKIPQVVKKSLKDPKSLLQEYVQAGGYQTPFYHIVSEVGPDHAKQFTVEVIINQKPYAQGQGASKQKAAQEAAQLALEKWEEEIKNR